MSKWPAPIIRFYLGQITPEAVLDAAHDSNANKKREQLCEANFYLGEWALQRGTKDEAARLFGLAAAECRKDVNLWADAKAELRALGVQPDVCPQQPESNIRQDCREAPKTNLKDTN
jgi:lipoprotein NlpI